MKRNFCKAVWAKESLMGFLLASYLISVFASIYVDGNTLWAIFNALPFFLAILALSVAP
jgi:hypothetical protein